MMGPGLGRLMKQNAGWLYAGEALPRLASLFVVPIWSARVAPGEYARWVLTLTAIELILQLSTMGLPTFLTKVLYRYRDRRIQDYFGLGATVIMGMTLLTALLMTLGSPILSRVLVGDHVRRDLFAWLALYVICAQVTNLAVLYLDAQVRFRARFLLMTGRWVGNVGFLLWFLLAWHQGFYSWVWAWVGTEALLIPMSLWYLRHVRWPGVKMRLLRFAFRYSFPSWVTDVLGWGQARMGRYVVAFSGLGPQVGLYGVAQNFSRYYGAVARPPKLVAMRALGHALEDDAGAPSFLAFFHGFSGFALCLAFLVGLFLGDLMKFVISPDYSEASVALAPLVFGLYLEEVYSLYQLLMFRYFKVWFHLFATLVTFAVVLVGTVLLVRPWGFLGAAVAQLAGSVAMVLFAHGYAIGVVQRPFRLADKLLATAIAFGLIIWAECNHWSMLAKIVMAASALGCYGVYHWYYRHQLFPSDRMAGNMAAGWPKASPKAEQAVV